MDSFQFSASKEFSQSLLSKFVLILFSVMIGSFIASFLVQFLGDFMELDYLQVIQNLQENTPLREKSFVKIALIISHLFTFILPALVFLAIIYKSKWLKFMNLHQKPSVIIIILAILLLIAAYPLAQFVYTINKNFPLPEWAIEQENLINTTIKHLLFVHTPTELIFNIFTIALLPAIGEELLFRGIVQQSIEKETKNAHLAVWATALIFSFIHFQFQGFLPRLFLGGILGYLLVWTRNLWIPIIAHFAYNGGQILLQYAHQKKVLGLDLNEVEVVPIWLVIISLIGTILIGYFCYHLGESKSVDF